VPLWFKEFTEIWWTCDNGRACFTSLTLALIGLVPSSVGDTTTSAVDRCYPLISRLIPNKTPRKLEAWTSVFWGVSFCKSDPLLSAFRRLAYSLSSSMYLCCELHKFRFSPLRIGVRGSSGSRSQFGCREGGGDGEGRPWGEAMYIVCRCYLWGVASASISRKVEIAPPYVPPAREGALK
jgi:hypothetical protein